ncbi:hypothetical protein O6H91_07G111300 [Diphasiastrum complanatum]|uniref:Uncharacterized protein n=1 Tax=Diphasiastrum complanatum TaxID=34168 RepID=A0ACC2D933_DIPCM|nr:hypothetical protein O6H91_07G111300 [Diphasiastrum complanatum]
MKAESVAILARTLRQPAVALATTGQWMSVAGAATASEAATTKKSTGLEAFFEAGREADLEKSPPYGRGWRASELRLKSWDDLHKLWYVLYKEKNMLLSQELMLRSQNVRLPNPERIQKNSMCRIKQVLTERALLEEDPRKRNILKKIINAK